jgi:nucleotide-binding universal stress UspA family protein
MFQRILIVWDGSQPAERALDLGLDFGEKYSAELLAASVVHPGHEGSQEEDRLCELFAERHAGNRDTDCPIAHEIIRGSHTGDDLLAYAHEHGFDLMVVGHHRDTKPGVLILHGVTEHLISAAELPVLVVGG